MAGFLDPILGSDDLLGPVSFPNLNDEVEAARLERAERRNRPRVMGVPIGPDQTLQEALAASSPSFAQLLAGTNPQEVLAAAMAPGSGLVTRGAEFLAPMFVGATHGVKHLPRFFHGTSSPRHLENILDKGFIMGRSAELQTPGTSLSRDPVVSTSMFSEGEVSRVLAARPRVRPEDVRNLRPSEFSRGVVPDDPFINKPNNFREAELFARREGEFDVSLLGFPSRFPGADKEAVKALMEEAAEDGVKMTFEQAARSLGLVPDVDVRRLSAAERKSIAKMVEDVKRAAQTIAHAGNGFLPEGGSPGKRLSMLSGAVRALRGHARLAGSMDLAAKNLASFSGMEFVAELEKLAPPNLPQSAQALKDAGVQIRHTGMDLVELNSVFGAMSDFVNPTRVSMGPLELKSLVSGKLGPRTRLMEPTRKLIEKIDAQIASDMPELTEKALLGERISTDKLDILYDDVARLANRRRAELADQIEDLEKINVSSPPKEKAR